MTALGLPETGSQLVTSLAVTSLMPVERTCFQLIRVCNTHTTSSPQTLHYKRYAQPRPALHCKVLPPGEFNDNIILESSAIVLAVPSKVAMLQKYNR